MTKDKNVDERLRLNREITFQEQQEDELYVEEKSIRNQVQHFQDQMNTLFRQEEVYYGELNEKGALSPDQDFALHEIKKEIGRLTENQSEHLATGYRAERNQLQENIEKLQKERNALAWD